MSVRQHDLAFNVAQLLREMIGAERAYQFTESKLTLDANLILENIEGQVRFIRTASGVLADAKARGSIARECTRCLKPTIQAIEVRIYDEFHSRIEVNSGVPLPPPDEEDPFYIDELHCVDLGEAIREYALMELPMQALCSPDCKGMCPMCGIDRNLEVCNCSDGDVDERLAALKALLH